MGSQTAVHMSDYQTLIERAIRGLKDDTAAARRTIYHRARAALFNALRDARPPVLEAVIAGECRQLEEAIQRVESERLRQRADVVQLAKTDRR
jgi:hypothetical protein